jgi:hypothetical protein
MLNSVVCAGLALVITLAASIGLRGRWWLSMQRRDEGFHDGRWPVTGQSWSWIVVSIIRRRGWPVFSYLIPFYFFREL